MKKIKIGLVGFGKHSLKIWLPILLTNEKFILTAISSEKVDSHSINSEVYRLTNGSYSPIEIFPNHNFLLKNAPIDCVLIATATAEHGSQVISALKSNKHVLCEKPLCFDDEEVEIISEISEKENLILETGFMYRFHPQWHFVKDYFNKVRNENWKILGQFQYNVSNHPNYRNSENQGGGAFLDAGCYFLDICEFLEIGAAITSRLTSKTLENGIDENSSLDLSFGGSQHASFHCSIKQVRFQSFSIFAENSFIQLESPFILPKNKKALVLERNEVGKIKQHFFEFTDCYQLELNNFAELIKSGGTTGKKNNGLNNARWLCDLRNSK